VGEAASRVLSVLTTSTTSSVHLPLPTRSRLLQAHHRGHHAQVSRTFCCEDCGDRFPNRERVEVMTTITSAASKVKSSAKGAPGATAYSTLCDDGQVLKLALFLSDKESVMQKLLCANGTACTAYAALGQPAKLSRSNWAKVCFRCEEQRIDARLKRAVRPRTGRSPQILEVPSGI
jgi:hypothetical protein